MCALLLVGACGAGLPPGSSSVPSWGAGSEPPPGPGLGTVRGQLAAALSARNLILADVKVPYRPGEPADLASVPRSVYQVQLRNDPAGGYIVVYELASPGLAAAAASSLATFLASGPGRVQVPLGTIHVLRQTGAAVVYYHWLPAAAIDPDTSKIQAALETVGIPVPVAR